MKQFKKVYIEITNICNLRCDFCPQTSRKLEFMQVDTFGKILEQIKPHTNYIYLHVKGEPLLHPSLDKLLDLSHEEGFNVNITTNGTLINNAREMLLRKAAVRQINFSLHSLDGNREFDNKDNYIQNILSFTKEAIQTTKMLVSLRLWNLYENSQVLLENRKNEAILALIEQEFDLSYKIQEAVGLNRGIKISDRVYLNQDHQFKWPDLKEQDRNLIGFCYGLCNQAAILVGGTVIPCCLDGEGIISLGNIHQTSFSEIIDSSRAKDMVNGFSKHKVVEKLCQKCGYMKRFKYNETEFSDGYLSNSKKK